MKCFYGEILHNNNSVTKGTILVLKKKTFSRVIYFIIEKNINLSAN